MTRPHFRCVALPLLLVFVLLGAGRGHCPMGGAATGTDGDPHSCCGTGLRSTAPSCCHAATAPGSAALSKVVASPAAPAAAAGYDFVADGTTTIRRPLASDPPRHRPRSPVLRI